MSKILDAQCAAGVVTVGILPVVDAEIMSEGVAPSTGALVMDEDRAFYITKTSGDLKTTLEKIATALSQIASALSLIDAKPTGTLPPAPVATANITAISSVQVELAALKELLK